MSRNQSEVNGRFTLFYCDNMPHMRIVQQQSPPRVSSNPSVSFIKIIWSFVGDKLWAVHSLSRQFLIKFESFNNCQCGRFMFPAVYLRSHHHVANKNNNNNNLYWWQSISKCVALQERFYIARDRNANELYYGARKLRIYSFMTPLPRCRSSSLSSLQLSISLGRIAIASSEARQRGRGSTRS